jgi:hypothetical protein
MNARPCKYETKKKEVNRLPAQEEHVQHSELGRPEHYKIILWQCMQAPFCIMDPEEMGLCRDWQYDQSSMHAMNAGESNSTQTISMYCQAEGPSPWQATIEARLTSNRKWGFWAPLEKLAGGQLNPLFRRSEKGWVDTCMHELVRTSDSALRIVDFSKEQV